jgi:pentatricopeptide repeat protein
LSSCLLLEYEMCGHIVEALKIFEEMQQKGVPNVFTCSAVICALDKGKQPEQALKIFEEMQQKGMLSSAPSTKANSRRRL